MRSSYLFLSFLLLSFFGFGQEIDKSKQIKLYKGIYTEMTGDQVSEYLLETLKTKKNVNGDYRINFLDEDAFLLPVFEHNKLKKVQIIFKNEDIEAIKHSLVHIESAFKESDGWTEVKSEDYVWLFYKKLEKKIDSKNQIAVYSLGIYHDEIGHRWHAILHIAPRMEDGDDLDQQMVDKKKTLIDSDL
ncbi:hypothetical protein [Flammeovirga agarivorans]|uniref:Uncharacterized protein n=1 Tax=Flammeovirga agarivorans TaxID=2726742 RepID=A0A7X8SHF6_9BACT|nr:hypothetical protein [Flammeovirga agarivorans]NLR90313.1 hypothetical protein [Flammeovirga agarivorans]